MVSKMEETGAMNKEEHPGEAGVLPEEMAQEPEENTYQVVDGKAVIPRGQRLLVNMPLRDIL